MTTPTLLITRPRGDEAELSDMLHDLGCRVIHEPLTEIFLNHVARGPVQVALTHEPHGIIVTSRHGVRALATLSELRDIALICVGDATADVAESNGFTRISRAGGNADRLIQFIADAYDPGSRFVYVCGAHVSTDMAAELSVYGMEVECIPAYEATASESLSDVVVEHFKRGQIDGVTFLSSRTAALFLELLEQSGIEEAIEQVDAYAMSPAIADVLADAGFRHIHTAEEATLASLVTSVDNAQAPR